MRAARRYRVKISVTVAPHLLRAVDEFIQQHPQSGRSKVLDDALQLWCAREQENAMEEQFTARRSALEEEESAAWRSIRAVAAHRVFTRGR